MNDLVTLTGAALAVAALFWWITRSREDRMTAIVTRLAATGILSSRAQLIDGVNHIPVALSLDASRIKYANADLDASIDVRQIDEVEYASDLVTGGIADGAVLRLRSHGRAFEFVLDLPTAERWCHRLPPHRMDEAGRVDRLASAR